MRNRFQHLIDWANQERLLAKARQRLKTGNADQMAADSLFRLNRAAKTGWAALSTYNLKNHLVRIYYQKGYCTRAVLAVQTLECWHTQSYLEGRTRYCPKCNNTGDYARHELYHFTFEIGGKRYTWHQPARLVDWPVTLTGNDRVVYEANEPDDIEAGDWKIGDDQALVYEYLKQAKVKMEPVKPLRRAIQMTWVEISSDAWAWYWTRTRKLRRWLRHKPWSKRLLKRLGDDIPF